MICSTPFRSLFWIQAAVVLLFAVGWATSSLAQTTPTDDGPAEHSITLDGEELFRVTQPLGPFTARERAERASETLARIADDPFFSPELFEVRVEGNEGLLIFRGELIGVVTARDADAESLSTEELLSGRLERVRASIDRYRERRLPEANIRVGLQLVLATVAFFLLLFATSRVHKNLRSRFAIHAAGQAESPTTAGAQPRIVVIHAVRQRVLSITRVAVVVILVLAYLECVFSLIPLTRAHATAILHYVSTPFGILWSGFLAHVGNLFFIAVVCVVTYCGLRFTRWLAMQAQRGAVDLPGIEPDNAMRLFKLFRIVALAAAAVTIFPYIPGSDSPAFRGLSLFFGAVLTLGASGSVGSFVGGVLLLFSRTFKVGDRIRVGDLEGDVVELDLMMSRLRTNKNEIVTAPNSTLLSGQVINYSTRAASDGLVLHTSVTIGYDARWRQVHELLLNAAHSTEGLLHEPPPFVHQKALSDFYVEYELNARTREPNRKADIYSRLHQNIQDEFNRAGVQIMSPHYEADPASAKLAPIEAANDRLH